MCGICGFVDAGPKASEPELLSLVRAMATTLSHRGPDRLGAWVDRNHGLALGHTRLSIIDLSETGDQPMADHLGRLHLIHNGEIYNFPQLKIELQKQRLVDPDQWRGGSDTEVLLACLENLGLQRTLEAINGMFAFACWDRKEGTLVLARDRMGEKPLYYTWADGCFLFASELKALRAHPAFQPRVDRRALDLFLRMGYVPAPWSIYQGVFKLPPACSLTVRPSDPANRPSPRPYWSLQMVAQARGREPIPPNPEEAVDHLEELLTDAVKMRMISDVPLGSFLSGGVDSSLVTALMQANSPRPVRTFTIGFKESNWDEAPRAKALAEYLGCEHTELYASPQRTLGLLESLPSVYDEPFADSSQIPVMLLATMTRKHVTVGMSGEGADELFCGYDRYQAAMGLLSHLLRLPLAIRKVISKGLRIPSSALWDKFGRTLGRLLPIWTVGRHPADRARRLANALEARDGTDFYISLLRFWPPEVSLVRGLNSTPCPPMPSIPPASLGGLGRWGMFHDQTGYLSDDLLVKVDRATMAVALEARAPMLDHRVVEFSWRLPMTHLVGGNQGKLILRRLLERYVPRSLTDGPKRSFGVPLAAWLRGPLSSWGEDMLQPRRLHRQGYFEPDLISGIWREHNSGRRDWQLQLWAVIMFQLWLEYNQLA